MAASLGASAQTLPPSSLDERTFFGFTIGGVTPRQSWRSESYYSLGGTRLWRDDFQVDQERGPAWLTDAMKVQLQTTSDGVIQEATLRVNTFRNLSEQLKPATRKQKFEELARRVSEKLGVKPEAREPMKWKLWPFDTRLPRIETEQFVWVRPWGQIHLISCTYESYPNYSCDEKGYAPVLLIKTKAMLDYYRQADEVAERERKATDARRTKM